MTNFLFNVFAQTTSCCKVDAKMIQSSDTKKGKKSNATK